MVPVIFTSKHIKWQAAGRRDEVSQRDAWLLPVAFDVTDEAERDRICCEVLDLDLSAFENDVELKAALSLAVDVDTNRAALCIFDPETVEARRGVRR